MSCNCTEGPSIIAELVEHLALELRFTLDEFEIHEAGEALVALQNGVTFLQNEGYPVPYVAQVIVDGATKNRH